MAPRSIGTRLREFAFGMLFLVALGCGRPSTPVAVLVEPAPAENEIHGATPSAPVGLAQVLPGNEVGFAVVKLGDLALSEPGRELKKLPEVSRALAELERTTSLKAEQIEYAGWLAVELVADEQPLTFIVAKEEFDPVKIQMAVMPKGRKETYLDKQLFVDGVEKGRRRALFFVEKRALVTGPVEQMTAYLEHRLKGPGPLTPAIAESGRHQVFAAVAPTRISRREGIPDHLQPLLAAKLAWLAGEFAEPLRFQAQLNFADETQAKEAEESAKDGLVRLRALLSEAGKKLPEHELLRKVLAQADSALQRAAVTRTGSTLVVRADEAAVAKVAARKDEGFGHFDPDPYLRFAFTEDQRFGIVMLKARDPVVPERFKKLTYAEDGASNNTCVKIDNAERLFGQAPGSWARADLKSKRLLKGVETIPGRMWVSAWDFPGRVRVTQTVALLPGVETRKLDSALIHYSVENRDSEPHKVGIRFMLDTYIGAEDGVPFAIPGESDLLTTKKDFANPKDIPEFIQALERSTLNDPGTVATMVLKFPPDFALQRQDPPLDPITRMVICRWPGDPDIHWDFTKGPDAKFWNMNDQTKGERNDSCITLYWEERLMPPKTKRVMAFTYGLGKTDNKGLKQGPQVTQLALERGSQPTPGGTFTVMAWTKNAKPGQKVKLQLPEGMSLDTSNRAEQVIPPAEKTGLSHVSWKVNVSKQTKDGVYTITATTTDATAKLNVRVFGGYGGYFMGGKP